MRLEEEVSGSPADWLRYAVSDLEVARTTPSSRILLEALCFHAQQAAEKSIRAWLKSIWGNYGKNYNY